MPKGKKKVEPKVKKELPKEVKVPGERDQLISRREELLMQLHWLEVNKFQDKGQIEVALSQVNQRLTQV
jgi:hypothetical protein